MAESDVRPLGVFETGNQSTFDFLTRFLRNYLSKFSVQLSPFRSYSWIMLWLKICYSGKKWEFLEDYRRPSLVTLWHKRNPSQRALIRFVERVVRRIDNENRLTCSDRETCRKTNFKNVHYIYYLIHWPSGSRRLKCYQAWHGRCKFPADVIDFASIDIF